jgi:hypothetical protein
MRTEIRNFLADKLEDIDKMYTTQRKIKAYQGVMNTLNDIIYDIRLDMASEIALQQIKKDK